MSNPSVVNAFLWQRASGEETMACIICDNFSASMEYSSCSNSRHGACRRCLKAALCQPVDRNPVLDGSGQMGCVAAGCDGVFELRELLCMLDTKAERAHVLSVVSARRRSTRNHAPMIEEEEEEVPETNSRERKCKATVSAKKGKKKVGVLAGRKLCEDGWVVIDNFFANSAKVNAETARLRPHFTPSEIWVGSSATVGAQVVVPSVRGDKVLWMCGASQNRVEPCDKEVDAKITTGLGARRLDKDAIVLFPALRDLLKAIDKFVFEEVAPNQLASRSDAMLAIYPGDGARFQAHVDNTSRDGRKFTVLAYLNEDWTDENGGHLRLHLQDSTTTKRDFLPKAGRLVIFRSDKIKHEVLATWHRPRAAITCWYYGKDERQETLKRATEDTSSSSLKGVEEATDAERRRAQQFANVLCDPHDATDNISLARRAAELPLNSQKILAAMAGVPETHFAIAMKRMTPDDLKALKDRFTRMGV